MFSNTLHQRHLCRFCRFSRFEPTEPTEPTQTPRPQTSNPEPRTPNQTKNQTTNPTNPTNPTKEKPNQPNQTHKHTNNQTHKHTNNQTNKQPTNQPFGWCCFPPLPCGWWCCFLPLLVSLGRGAALVVLVWCCFFFVCSAAFSSVFLGVAAFSNSSLCLLPAFSLSLVGGAVLPFTFFGFLGRRGGNRAIHSLPIVMGIRVLWMCRDPRV